MNRKLSSSLGLALFVCLNWALSFGSNPTFINNYQYERPIVIDHTKVANTDQTDFPVLISGTLPDLATVANGGNVQNANGYDIIFTSDADGQVKLDHEIDTYNPVNGAMNCWVRIPSLSHTTDTTIYMWYGNSSVTTSQENKAGVWRNGFVAAYHFGDGSTLSVLDSTGVNNGTNHGVTAGAGQIGGSSLFSSNGSQYIDVGAGGSLNLTQPLTISAWLKASAGTSGVVFGAYNANSPYNGYGIAVSKVG